MDFFWMVDVSPVIRALTGPKPHVIWHATYGDTTLALVNASDRMPILQKHQIHATFFLSGRSLHGMGPYWWTRL